MRGTNNESIGNIWHVCDIDVTETGAAIKRLETYESKLLKTRASSVQTRA